MRTLLNRWRDWRSRRQVADRFAEEMQFHRDALEAEHRRRGLSEDEARVAAARELGNVTGARERIHERAGWPWLENWLGDLNFARRGLVRRPVLSLGVIAILAVGLALATTMHGIVEGLFFQPLPVAAPERLQMVLDAQGRPVRWSRGTIDRLAAALPEDGVVGLSGGTSYTVEKSGAPATLLSGRLVTGGFFRVLPVKPAAGRLLEESDDVIGKSSPVLVLSHGGAVELFGSAEAAVGRELRVNRVNFAVVGVLAPDFRDATVGGTNHLWMTAVHQRSLQFSGNADSISSDDRPNNPDWNLEERVSWLELLVRRPAPGAPAPQGALLAAFGPQREQIALALDVDSERAELARRSFQFVPAPSGKVWSRGQFSAIAGSLGLLVGTVLLLAAANISGLLLVRALTRHREIGVRLALGSDRWRVGRLALAEVAWLTGCGALLGVLLAAWLTPLAAARLAPGLDVPALWSGLRPLAGAVGIALLLALACAAAPALLIARMQPMDALRGLGRAGRSPVRFGRWLVVAQLSLAVLLVALAHTLGREFDRTLAADPGFERTTVLTATFNPAGAGYDEAAKLLLYDRIEQVVRGMPGVERAGLASSGVLRGSRSNSGLNLRNPDARVRQGHYQQDTVRAGYLETIGATLLRGRFLTDADRRDAPYAAVITAAFAREVFGELDPLGERFGFDTRPGKDDWIVVGVIGDLRVNGIRETAPAMFFVPQPQSHSKLGALAVRFRGDREAMQKALRAALAKSDPGLVFSGWSTLEERVRGNLRESRSMVQLATVCAGGALLLASLGAGAQLAYLVVLRRREFALRSAIGAGPAAILRGVLQEATRLGTIGAVLGLVLVGSLPSWRAVAGWLPERPGWSAALLAAAVGVLVTVLAGWVPARRAARANPLELLKRE